MWTLIASAPGPQNTWMTEGDTEPLLMTESWTFTCPLRTQHPVPTPSFHWAWLNYLSQMSSAQRLFPNRHAQGNTISQNNTVDLGSLYRDWGPGAPLRGREFHSLIETWHPIPPVLKGIPITFVAMWQTIMILQSYLKSNSDNDDNTIIVIKTTIIYSALTTYQALFYALFCSNLFNAHPL